MQFLKSVMSLGVGALFLASCNNTSTSGSSTNAVSALSIESFTNDTSAAKQTFFLRLVDEVDTDSSVVYTGRSSFGTDTVALKIEVLKNIAPGLTSDGKIDEANAFTTGSIKFSSAGSESDNLVKALGAIFKLPTDGKIASTTITPLVFSSNKEVVDLKKNGTYSFKLAFDNQSGGRAEAFAVLDTYRKGFEISEKDSTYRNFLISAFEGK